MEKPPIGDLRPISYYFTKLYPNTALSHIQKYSTGLSKSEVYSVTINDFDHVVIKVFPQEYKERVDREVEALIYLDQFSHIPSAKVINYAPDLVDTKGLLVMQQLPGNSLYDQIQNHSYLNDIADAGRAIARLHSLPYSHIWQNKHMWIANQDDWITLVKTRSQAHLQRIVVSGILSEQESQNISNRLRGLIFSLQNELLLITLLHGDYHPQNILVDNSGDVTGVLDFEQHRMGHSLQELGVFRYWLALYDKEDLFSSFIRGYAETQPFTSQNLQIVNGYYLMHLLWGLSYYTFKEPDLQITTKLSSLVKRQLTEMNK